MLEEFDAHYDLMPRFVEDPARDQGKRLFLSERIAISAERSASMASIGSDIWEALCSEAVAAALNDPS